MHYNKGYGQHGLPVQGGWNKGLRYGEVIRPEEVQAQPIAIRKVKCECGSCKRCRRRVYQRLWDRLNRRTDNKSDAELDAMAMEWLERNR